MITKHLSFDTADSHSLAGRGTLKFETFTVKVSTVFSAVIIMLKCFQVGFELVDGIIQLGGGEVGIGFADW